MPSIAPRIGRPVTGPAAADRSELGETSRAAKARLAALTEQVSRKRLPAAQDPGSASWRLAAGRLPLAAVRAAHHGLCAASYQLDGRRADPARSPARKSAICSPGDGLALEALPGVCFVGCADYPGGRQLANLERPWLGPFHKADHELLLPGRSRIRRVLRSSPLRPVTSSSTACWCFPASTRCASPRRLGERFSLAHLGLGRGDLHRGTPVNSRAALLRSGIHRFSSPVFHNRRYLHARPARRAGAKRSAPGSRSCA